MWAKNLKKFGIMSVPSLLLLLLLLLAFCRPLQSLEKFPDGSVKLSAQEYQAVITEVKGLQQDLDSLSKINSNQAITLREQLTTIESLQTDNKQQAGLLTAQKLGLTNLTASLESQKTLTIILGTIDIISILGNIAQGIAYQYK